LLANQLEGIELQGANRKWLEIMHTVLLLNANSEIIMHKLIFFSV